MPLKRQTDEIPEINLVTQTDEALAGGIEQITALIRALKLSLEPKEHTKHDAIDETKEERIKAQEVVVKDADDFLTSANEQRVVLLRALKLRLKNLNDEYDRMDQANADYYEREAESQVTVENLEAENARLRREIGELKGIEETLTKGQSGYAELEKKKVDVEKKNEDLRQSLAAAERTAKEWEVKTSELAEDRDRNFRELQDSRKAEEHLRDVKKAELESHQRQTRDLWDGEIEPRKIELANLQKELDEARDENCQLQQEVQDANQLAGSQEEEVTRLRRRVFDLTTQAETLWSEMSRKDSEWTASQEQMDGKVSGLKQQLRDQETSTQRLQDQVSTLTFTIDGASAEYSREKKDWLSVKTKLDSEISGLTQSSGQLTTELVDLRKTIANAQKENGGVERRCREAQDRVETLEKDLQTEKAKLQESISAGVEAGERIQALEMHLAQKVKETDSEVLSIRRKLVECEQDAQGKMRELRCDKATLEATLEALRSKAQILERENSAAKKEVSVQARSTKDHSQEIEVLRSRIEELKKQSGAFGNLSTERDSRITVLEAKVHHLEENARSVLDAAQSVKILESERRKIQEDLSASQARVLSLEQENAQIRKNAEDSASDIATLREQKQVLERAALEDRSRDEGTQQELAEKQKVLEEEQQRGGLLEAEVEKQKIAASTLEGQVAFWKVRTEELEQENLTAAQQLEASSASERDFRDLIRQLKADRNRCEADIQELRDRLHRAQAAEEHLRIQIEQFEDEKGDREGELEALRDDVNCLEVEKRIMGAVKENLLKDLAACQADLQNVGRGIRDTGRTRRRRLVPLDDETLRRIVRQWERRESGHGDVFLPLGQ